MCGTCGCGEEARIGPRRHDAEGDERAHAHVRAHAPQLTATVPMSRMVAMEIDLLAKNDRLAADNRACFAARGIVAVNLMSSPGAGKTTLLERTIRRLSPQLDIAVIEGDQETERDGERIRATGVPVVQINTGAGCHLDAAMVARGVAELAPRDGALLLVENVGNLVCPALFDLGERTRVVLMSVTEGEDKPLKYPHMFRAAQVLVVTKTDLLPHLDFDLDACLACARQVNPRLAVFLVSAKSGDGMDAWCGWLRDEAARREPVR